MYHRDTWIPLRRSPKFTTVLWPHSPTVSLTMILVLSLQGKCQRKDPPCKYLHPPQHLREQLLQNGKNNLILKNLQMQAMAAGLVPMGAPVGIMPPVSTKRNTTLTPHCTTPLCHSTYITPHFSIWKHVWASVSRKSSKHKTLSLEHSTTLTPHHAALHHWGTSWLQLVHNSTISHWTSIFQSSLKHLASLLKKEFTWYLHDIHIHLTMKFWKLLRSALFAFLHVIRNEIGLALCLVTWRIDTLTPTYMHT